jgi:hypothetical protein
MFSIFKSDPTKKLNKNYFLKLEQAMLAQRNGDIRSYSLITNEAEQILREISKIEALNG